MARKPPDWRQPSLPFTPDPDKTTEPQDQSLSKTEGDQHAIQDDHSRTPATTAGDARTAPKGAEASADDGPLRARAEDQPRSLEGDSLRGEAGQRPEPDRERGDGDGTQGVGGSFTDRVSSGQQRTPFARRGNGVHPGSHVGRLKASRKQPTLFDSLSNDAPPATPVPPGALSDGTEFSPPGRASGNPVPPEGLPPFSAGPVASRAEPRLGAESSPSRQAPMAGPETPGEGDLTVSGTQLSLQFDAPPPPFPPADIPELTTGRVLVTDHPVTAAPVAIASGEKGKARDILAA